MQARTELTARFSIKRTLLACCIALLAFAAASAKCTAPRYREGQLWENSDSTVLMSVSVPLQDFAPERLICLAQAFRDRYQERKSITILIFSSPEAAKRYLPRQADNLPPKTIKEQRLQSSAFWLSQLHGLYSYNVDAHQEYLDIRPVGSDIEGPFDTRIDLPVATTPHCRFETSGRCLLALEDVTYPSDALKARISGTVTLTATIASDGKIKGIHVAHASANPAEKMEILSKAAAHDLATWRLEGAPHEDPFQITFSYVIDTTLPRPGDVTVKVALPNQVTIRGNPPK